MRVARLTLFFVLCCGISAQASPLRQNGSGMASLPLAAQSRVSATVGYDFAAYHIQPVKDGFIATNSNQNLTTNFRKSGVEVRAGNMRWRVRLLGYGYGSELQAAAAIAPQASANRVEYRRLGLTEWYVNGPAGLEQGFTLLVPPKGKHSDWLTLALSVSGALKASSVGGDDTGITLSGPSGEKLRYQGLTAFDASGKELHARLRLATDRVWLQVSDATARYPITVDPWVQQAKLTASDGVGGDQLAGAVAIDGDTNTIVVGAFSATVGTNPSQGAAYVFVEPSTGWADMTQVAKLTASDGLSSDQFGSSIAISDGVIVVGSPYAGISNANCAMTSSICFNQGAAYVFVEPSGGWVDSTETAKLTASDGLAGDELGYAVGIDSSTGTIAAGAPNAAIGAGCPSSPCTFFQGAAYVFVEPSDGWASTTQTAKLTASNGTSDDGFGQSVAVSGITAVVGAPYAGISDTYSRGAAYVYVAGESGWADATETAELTAGDGNAGAQFGCSVGIDIDGLTIAVGALGQGTDSLYQQGSAYVYVMPDGGWTTTSTATAELTASDGAIRDQFGTSVSINQDTVVVGAPSAMIGSNAGQGAAYVYVEPSDGWVSTSSFDAKMTAGDGAPGDSLGSSISISDGAVVVGAPFAAISGVYSQGAGYVFQ